MRRKLTLLKLALLVAGYLSIAGFIFTLILTLLGHSSTTVSILLIVSLTICGACTVAESYVQELLNKLDFERHYWQRTQKEREHEEQ